MDDHPAVSTQEATAQTIGLVESALKSNGKQWPELGSRRLQAASHLKTELRRWREVFHVIRHLPVARFHLHDADTPLSMISSTDY